MVQIEEVHQEQVRSPTDDPLRNSQEFAFLARVKSRTPEAWRGKGIGPPYIKVGSRVFYRQSAIDQWLHEQVRKPQRVQNRGRDRCSNSSE